MIKSLRVLAWEVTRQCPMQCKHCRGASRNISYDNELSTDEAFHIIDSLHAAQAHPMIIFTGGEPMVRADLESIISHASELGFPCVLAPCGKFITEARLQALKAAGVRSLSLSIDGPNATIHDAFRGVAGAFAFASEAMAIARRVGMPFQVNHTVSSGTLHSLREMRDFAIEQGAQRIDYFFLVPVGRGKDIVDACLNAQELEDALTEILALDDEGKLPIHVTCAPQIVKLLASHPHKSRFNGCMAGAGFCFLSHVGTLQPCGFFDKSAGNVHDFEGDFVAAYEQSELFAQLRQGPDKGGCGACDYRLACRGCRARAYALTGDICAADTCL